MQTNIAKKALVLLFAAALTVPVAGCANTGNNGGSPNNGNNGNNGVQQQGMRTNRQDAVITRRSISGYNANNIDTNGNNPGTGTDNDRTNRVDNTANNGNDRFRIADRAADEITRIPGVQSANVLITRNNAYVAAVTNDGRNDLGRETEDRIAQAVRRVDPGIMNVYVSTNPDFVDRINTYVNDVQQGRPISGFVNEFNEMIQRIFPNAR